MIYIYTLIIVSVVGGLINSYISSFGNIKKYVSYFTSVLMVICMLSPITNIVKNMSELKNNISNLFDKIATEDIINNSNDIIINTGIDAISKGIKNELITKFGFNENEIIIDLEIDKSYIEAIKITKIKIILTGKASWSDVDAVKKYIENIIGGDISVTRR